MHFRWPMIRAIGLFLLGVHIGSYFYLDESSFHLMEAPHWYTNLWYQVHSMIWTVDNKSLKCEFWFSLCVCVYISFGEATLCIYGTKNIWWYWQRHNNEKWPLSHCILLGYSGYFYLISLLKWLGTSISVYSFVSQSFHAVHSIVILS